jgi:hypothetical protein
MFALSVQASSSTPELAKGTIVLLGTAPSDLKMHWQRADKSDAAWKSENGTLKAGGGDIFTRQEFGDFHLHVEFKVPLMNDRTGQRRGNSGIKLHGRYEIQILDSYGKENPGTGDCGALYQHAAPLVNACKQPNEWQTFDIIFRAPRFDKDGKLVDSARVTVLQNGIPVQNNQIVQTPTGRRGGTDQSSVGPIRLQDHGAPVEFRNIWILPLPARGAAHY